MKSAVYPERLAYDPDTSLDIHFTWPDTYDLGDKDGVFEIRLNKACDVVFRYRTGVDAGFVISGQTASLSLPPDAASQELTESPTLDEVFEGKRTMEFNVDFQVTGSEEVDYRVRGEVIINPTHGK